MSAGSPSKGIWRGQVRVGRRDSPPPDRAAGTLPSPARKHLVQVLAPRPGPADERYCRWVRNTVRCDVSRATTTWNALQPASVLSRMRTPDRSPERRAGHYGSTAPVAPDLPTTTAPGISLQPWMPHLPHRGLPDGVAAMASVALCLPVQDQLNTREPPNKSSFPPASRHAGESRKLHSRDFGFPPAPE